MFLKCKHCLSSNDALARFCGACGRKLLRTTRFIRNATGEISRADEARNELAATDGPRCSRCNAFLVGTASFCTACGARLDSKTGEKQQNASPLQGRADGADRPNQTTNADEPGGGPPPQAENSAAARLLKGYAAILSAALAVAAVLAGLGVFELRIPGRAVGDADVRGARQASSNRGSGRENAAPLAEHQRVAVLDALRRLRRFTGGLRPITGDSEPGVESRRLKAAAQRLKALGKRLETGPVDRADVQREIREVRADLEFSVQALDSVRVLGVSMREALSDLEQAAAPSKRRREH